MSNLLVGMYALYFLFSAYKGNSSKVMSDVQKDAPGFLPWMVAIVVLSMLYNNDKSKKIAEPFIFLAVLTFVLQNFSTIKGEVTTIYKSAGGTINMPPANQTVT